MCRKLFLLTSFLLLLALVSTNVALADVIEIPIATDEDDVEEHGDWDGGAMESLTSSDLEMPYEDTGMDEKQIIGLRYTDITIPKGATITAAWVQFQVDDDEDGTLPVNLIIEGELSANAAGFTSDALNVTSRPRTTAQVQWSVPNWATVDDWGPDQATSDIAAVIQEIVNQDGWASGNSLVLIISDDPANPSEGIRCAEAGPGDESALLHVEFGAAPALPQGWQSQDIGTTGGSAAESDGTWAISADGADIWWRSDQFHYAHVPLSGDGTIVARVVDNGTGSNAWAKGGVMIRETLEQDSKHAIMALTGGSGGGKAFQHRPITDQRSMSAHGGDPVAPPMWVKLTRVGNTFTGYYSTDGVTWEQQPDISLDPDPGPEASNPATIKMAADVYIGLFVTSHASGELRTYTFDNVRVVSPGVIAIEEVLNQYTVAMNTGDLELWLSLHADDVVKMPPDEPAIFGKEELRANNEPVFNNFTLEMVLYPEEAQVDGELGFAWGNYTLSLTPIITNSQKAGGDTAYLDGKYLTICKRQADGSWKIYIDCYNSNVPPTVE